MKKVIEREGEGPKVPNGMIVSVHYRGKLASNHKEFDNSYSRGAPIEFTVGVGEVIPGWDQAILTMSKGEKAVVTIPPHLAYGSSGAGSSIPPNSTLVFEMEIIDFKEGPPGFFDSVCARIEVALFIPNLIGYFRFATLFGAAYFALA